MAQNVIVPIVDLTQAAEGSTVSENLQTALSFDSQTVFDFSGSSGTIVNNAGFWRVFGSYSLYMDGTNTSTVIFTLSDGLSSKVIYQTGTISTGAVNFDTGSYDFVVYLNAGESLNGQETAGGYGKLIGSVRQIADTNGNLINPAGFNPQ